MEPAIIASEIKKLLEAGYKTGEIVSLLKENGVSRATTLRYMAKIKADPNAEKSSGLPVYLTVPENVTPENIILPPIRADDDSPTAQIVRAAKDMRKVRENAMQEGEDYDPRTAIGAAQAEAQILMGAAKLAKEMRDSARDDITLHPQMAEFRDQLLRVIAGTEAEAAVVNLFAQWERIDDGQS